MLTLALMGRALRIALTVTGARCLYKSTTISPFPLTMTLHSTFETDKSPCSRSAFTVQRRSRRRFPYFSIWIAAARRQVRKISELP